MINYNTQLQSNNTDLQAILNTINELPEASGEQATPVISINSTNGLITATAGAKSSTYQLAFQSAKTIAPSSASQIAVSSGYYTGGNITVAAVPTQTKTVTPKATTQNVTPDSGKFLSEVTVNGDSNLVAGNIKSGVSIFGVSGTLEEGGGSGSGEVSEWSENEDAIIKGLLSGDYFNDRVGRIGSYAFYGLTSLTSVNFPNCLTIGANAFDGCRTLTSANFPDCNRINENAFSNCSSLKTVNLPRCSYIGRNAFFSCSNLTTISLPKCSFIANMAFQKCNNLKSIYLMNSSYICTLDHTLAFSYTGIGSTKGSIFVPASLVSAYKESTNWTYYSDRIFGI